MEFGSQTDARNLGNRVVAFCDQVLVAQRMMQPMPQQPRAHGCLRGIEQRIQRRRGLATQRCVNLQIAPRRGIQLNVLAGQFDAQARNMRQRGALRVFHIFQQRTCGGNCYAKFCAAEAR